MILIKSFNKSIENMKKTMNLSKDKKDMPTISPHSGSDNLNTIQPIKDSITEINVIIVLCDPDLHCKLCNRIEDIKSSCDLFMNYILSQDFDKKIVHNKGFPIRISVMSAVE